MWIMTAEGWKQLSPKEYTQAGHTPTMLEANGIDAEYDGVKAIANYANGNGRGYYFTYNPDGTSFQSKGAINPLIGMIAEEAEPEPELVY